MINWNTLKLGSILFGATRQQITIQRQITYANLLLKNKKENIIVFNFNKLRDIKKSEEDIARIANFEKKLDLEKKLNVDKKIKEKKSSKNKNYIFQNKGGNWESENYREKS